MVNDILIQAGFIKNKTFKETCFLQPPKETYCVYHDSYERRGGDNINLIKEHDITIEMYQYTPDSQKELALEHVFDLLGIEYTKQERYRLTDEQLYQVVYDFSYIEKGVITNE